MPDRIPEGWSFDPDYGYDGSPAWWHDDCPTPTVIDEGELGGIAHEERLNGHLVAVVCGDCDATFSINRRPKQALAALHAAEREKCPGSGREVTQVIFKLARCPDCGKTDVETKAGPRSTYGPRRLLKSHTRRVPDDDG